MQLIKRCLSFIIRLIVVDGALIIFTWLECIISGLVSLLQPYAIFANAPKLLRVKELQDTVLDAVTKDIYIVQQTFDIETGKAVECVTSYKDEIKNMIDEFRDENFDYDDSDNGSLA